MSLTRARANRILKSRAGASVRVVLCVKVSNGNSANDYSRVGLFFSDCGGATTKREGGRYRRSVWWYGFTDDIWAERFGDGAVESDNSFSDTLHADKPDAFSAGDSGCGSRFDGVGTYKGTVDAIDAGTGAAKASSAGEVELG